MRLPQNEAEREEFERQVKEFAHSDAIEFLLEGLKVAFTEHMLATSPADAEKREHDYRMVRAIDALKNEIISVATNGMFEEFKARRILKNPIS